MKKYLQNDVQIVEKKGNQRIELNEKVRVEIITPTPNRNLVRTHVA